MKVFVFIVSSLLSVMPIFAQRNIVADPPEVRGPFTLTAIYDSASGRNAFSFNGKAVPPVIRVFRGDAIQLHYVNNLPTQSNEKCATGPCTNMTNLHFMVCTFHQSALRMTCSR